MYQVRLFVLFAVLTASFLMLLGLYQPRIVLWWEDVQNRRKVLRVYGTVALATFILYLLLGLL
jgi:hypothetical protein